VYRVQRNRDCQIFTHIIFGMDYVGVDKYDDSKNARVSSQMLLEI
jgi:hypothetical protein